MPWLPEFVINFITSRALTEATGWLKKESELEQTRQPRSIVTVNSSVTTTLEVEEVQQQQQPQPLLQCQGGAEQCSAATDTLLLSGVHNGGSGGFVKIQLKAVAVSLTKRLTNLVVSVRQCLLRTARRLGGLLLFRKQQ